MTKSVPERRRKTELFGTIAGMPTGGKVFLILSCALLPLALIGFFATLQTSRIADQEVRARLRVAIHEAARALRGELAWELREMRGALPEHSGAYPNCGRLAGLFEPQAGLGIRYAVLDANKRLLCGEPVPSIAPAALDGEARPIMIHPGVGVQIEVRGEGGHIARAFFPTSFLRRAAEPTAMGDHYALTLTGGGRALDLRKFHSTELISRTESQSASLNIEDLNLEMSVPSAPVTSSAIVAALAPFAMWFLAAAIAWFVVDRMLIYPLRRLRATVGAYQPGQIIDPIPPRGITAREIQALGDTFRDLSRTVQLHEEELAQGLTRQTQLTREVHHRVKNNLQVIASLINFHARVASEAGALKAYASIQRRVDALAVVHRHHYAGFEATPGIELRAVIGELASSIRATTSEPTGVSILLDIEPLLVSQDSAVAISFLITEFAELAMQAAPGPQIRISTHAVVDQPSSAMLRISSPALRETPEFTQLYDHRYGRVIGGLVRQLRSKLHHDQLTGAFELMIAVTGRS